MVKKKLAVFVSGRGSNLAAILTNSSLSRIAEVNYVFSDKTNCGASEICKDSQIPFFTISNFIKDTENLKRVESEVCTVSLDSVVRVVTSTSNLFWEEICNLLLKENIDLIVLAGFLKLLPSDFVEKFPFRIINIHPALLPSFGGKGMYGMNVHKAVFNSSAKLSGATIHFVNSKYDEGLIINQRGVYIGDVENPNEIAERVLEIEHKILPETIEMILNNRIKISNNRVYITKEFENG